MLLKKNSNKNKKYDSEDSMDEGIIKFTAWIKLFYSKYFFIIFRRYNIYFEWYVRYQSWKEKNANEKVSAA